MTTSGRRKRSHFVEIKNCDDCPFKEYGLRKCEVADHWFDDGEYFEPENEIPSWCPKCTPRVPIGEPAQNPMGESDAVLYQRGYNDGLQYKQERE